MFYRKAVAIKGLKQAVPLSLQASVPLVDSGEGSVWVHACDRVSPYLIKLLNIPEVLKYL
jgi:hypothetical protein